MSHNGPAPFGTAVLWFFTVGLVLLVLLPVFILKDRAQSWRATR